MNKLSSYQLTRVTRYLFKCYHYERGFSRILPQFIADHGTHQYKKFRELSFYPAELNYYATVYHVMRKHLGIKEFYPKLIKETGDMLKPIMSAKYQKRMQRSFTLLRKEKIKIALDEQIARGFIPIEQFGELDRKNGYYIKSNIKPLVYPKKFGYHLPEEPGKTAYDALFGIGVKGYTGLLIPKHLKT